jgi:hypothetical protein
MVVVGSFSRDQSCVRALSYRMDLARPEDSTAFGELLVRLGYAKDLERPSPGFEKWRSSAGHEVFVVPRTGRVQFRVSYIVAADERRRVAEGFFASVVRGARGAA